MTVPSLRRSGRKTTSPTTAIKQEDIDSKPRRAAAARKSVSPSTSTSSSSSSSKHTETALLQPQLPYPAVKAKINDEIIYSFFRYCAERHKIYHRKEAGIKLEELSEDQLFVQGRYGNVFRQLDRGSTYVREQIVEKGDQSNEEICFRVFLYNVFSNTETYARWEQELGEIPSLKNFDLNRYTAILDPVVANGGRIYSSGFQLVPPTNVFPNMSGHAASLRLLKLMVDVDLASRIQKCKYIVDASALVQTLPTLGGFLSLNLLCYLNESPHINLEYRNWASCGPGARETLAKIFGHNVINSVAMEEAGLLWLYENQWRYWARLGEQPPQAPGIPPGMRVLDFENALCWHHRYMAAQRARNIPFAPAPEYDAAVTEIAVNPSKANPPAAATTAAAINGDVIDVDAEEDGEDKKMVDATLDEGVYEIEKVINRRNNTSNIYRVRWAGYPPEEDTWEHESTIVAGGKEALDDYKEWLKLVTDTIVRINKTMKFKTRLVTKGCDIAKNKRKNQVVVKARPASSRPRRAPASRS